jgi:hypothetical protein
MTVREAYKAIAPLIEEKPENLRMVAILYITADGHIGIKGPEGTDDLLCVAHQVMHEEHDENDSDPLEGFIPDDPS